MFKTPVIALVSLVAVAQTQIDLPTQAKRIDFTTAAATRPVKTGINLPATCTVGDLFFKTNAPAGGNLYGCATTNNWAPQGAGGESGTTTVQSNGTVIGSRSTTNYVAGSGLTNLFTDTGSRINVQIGLDTALVQTQAGEQEGSALLCASSSAAGAHRCSLTPTLAAYTNSMVLHWKPDNGGGNPTTLNVDTLGAIPVKLADGITDPGAMDLIASHLYDVWYDGSVFRIRSQDATPSATLTADRLSSPFFCLDTGSVDVYKCDLNPTISAYFPGTVYWFRANSANSGPASINFNSLGPKIIKKSFNQDLAANDIRAGQWLMMTYDGANMQAQIPGAQSGNGLRTLGLGPMGGYNDNAAGFYPLWTVTGLSPQRSDIYNSIAFSNATTSVLSRTFRWPADWDNSKSVDILITWGDGGDAGGQMALAAKFSCLSSGASMFSPGVWLASGSTGSIAASPRYSWQEAMLPNVAATPCLPDQTAAIAVYRDNAIAGNSPDEIKILDVSIRYHAH